MCSHNVLCKLTQFDLFGFFSWKVTENFRKRKLVNQIYTQNCSCFSETWLQLSSFDKNDIFIYLRYYFLILWKFEVKFHLRKLQFFIRFVLNIWGVIYKDFGSDILPKRPLIISLNDPAKNDDVRNSEKVYKWFAVT